MYNLLTKCKTFYKKYIWTLTDWLLKENYKIYTGVYPSKEVANVWFVRNNRSLTMGILRYHQVTFSLHCLCHNPSCSLLLHVIYYVYWSFTLLQENLAIKRKYTIPILVSLLNSFLVLSQLLFSNYIIENI